MTGRKGGLTLFASRASQSVPWGDTVRVKLRGVSPRGGRLDGSYLEEAVSFDLQSVLLSCSQPHLWILLQQLEEAAAHQKGQKIKASTGPTSPNLLDEGRRLRGQEARAAHVVVDDAVKHLLLIIAWKRRLRGHQSTPEHQRPSRTWTRASRLPVLSQDVWT